MVKLYSLQCLHKLKNILFIFVLISSLTLLNAGEIKISPTKINLYGNLNDKLCDNIKIYSDYNIINVETKWSNKNSHNLIEYNISLDNLGIIEEFNKTIYIKSYDNREFCFIFTKPGKYNGALVFLNNQSFVGAGLWISAKVIDNSTENNINSRLISITGNIIKEKIDNNFNFLLVLPSFLLLLLLILIIKYNLSAENLEKFPE